MYYDWHSKLCNDPSYTEEEISRLAEVAQVLDANGQPMRGVISYDSDSGVLHQWMVVGEAIVKDVEPLMYMLKGLQVVRIPAAEPAHVVPLAGCNVPDELPPAGDVAKTSIDPVAFYKKLTAEFREAAEIEQATGL